MNGTIFNIQHFCTQDGPGIRTTVFVKGCPLRCAWCHNPESHLKSPEVMYYPQKCIGCGACSEVCDRCHHLSDGRHLFDRTACVSCGKCAEVCPAEALIMSGKSVSSEDVLNEVFQDIPFYETSGGGMTLSGGEPLYQPEFSLELAKGAKSRGVSVAIETSGCVCADTLSAFAPFVDVFLFDLKHSDEEAHKRYTGVGLSVILQNLALLNDFGANIILRCPIIPEVNFTREHFGFIAATSESFRCISAIELEPYHPLGLEKAKTLGRTVAYANPDFLQSSDVTEAIRGIDFPVPVRVN